MDCIQPPGLLCTTIPCPLEQEALLERFYLAAAFLLRIFAKRLFLREAVFL